MCGMIASPLRSLEAKVVVDFANGIDVVRDHVRVQNSSRSVFQRVLSGLNGDAARRQAEVNAALADGVEGSLACLVELAEQITFSTLAIAKVSERVHQIQSAVVSVADYSVHTRRKVDELASVFDQHRRQITERLLRVELRLEAYEHRDAVFHAWGAGRYSQFSALGRCYAVLEELRWGTFGHYYRSLPEDGRRKYGVDLVNRSVLQLMTDLAVTQSARLSITDWTTYPVRVAAGSDAAELLAYLGEGYDPDRAPFVHVVSQLPGHLPLEVPKLCTAVRATEALLEEVLENCNE